MRVVVAVATLWLGVVFQLPLLAVLVAAAAAAVVVPLPRCHQPARLSLLASQPNLAPLTARRIHRHLHSRRLTLQNMSCL